MSRTPADQPRPDGPTREKFAELMTRLRGDVPITEVAKRLPPGQGSKGRTGHATHQSVMDLERGWHTRKDRKDEPAYWSIGNPSLERLDEIARAYGLVFEVIARDPETDEVVYRDAPGLRRPLPKDPEE